MTTGEATETDWPALYAEHVADLVALAGSLAPGEEATSMPATPAWSVRDVYAHLAGVAADNIDGRTEGAPGPEWTARQVGERQGLSLADLTTELQGHVGEVQHGMREGTVSPGVVWDAATHHADLHEALGRGRVPEHLWRPVLDRVGPGHLAPLPGAAALLAGEAGVAPYEVWRAVFSRRSRAQLRAWPVGLSEGQAGAIGVFGPRDDDQPVP